MTNLNRYIDNCIINEYAAKKQDGYTLDVKKLPQNEIDHFLDELMNKDMYIKELILERMQDLIDQRIPFVETYDYYDAGFIPQHDSETGEVNWVKRGLS